MLETAEGNRTNTTGGSEVSPDQNRSHEPPFGHVSAENDDENTRGDDLQSEQHHHRSRRGQIGAILLVLGASLLVPLSLSGSVPALLGSVAALLLALGTLLFGTAIRGRSV